MWIVEVIKDDQQKNITDEGNRKLDTAEERIREFKSRRKYPDSNAERQKKE